MKHPGHIRLGNWQHMLDNGPHSSPWDVLSLGHYVPGTFCPWDVLSLGRFVAWDVLSLGTFCPLGRFVLERFLRDASVDCTIEGHLKEGACSNSSVPACLGIPAIGAVLGWHPVWSRA